MPKTMPCCECGEDFSYTGPKNLAGRRCPLCAQENYVRWLQNLGNTIRDGEPDGRTPAMRPGQREEHNKDLASEIKKLKKMRTEQPSRASKYREKNKDGYSAPYDVRVVQSS